VAEMCGLWTRPFADADPQIVCEFGLARILVKIRGLTWTQNFGIPTSLLCRSVMVWVLRFWSWSRAFLLQLRSILFSWLWSRSTT